MIGVSLLGRFMANANAVVYSWRRRKRRRRKGSGGARGGIIINADRAIKICPLCLCGLLCVSHCTVLRVWLYSRLCSRDGHSHIDLDTDTTHSTVLVPGTIHTSTVATWSTVSVTPVY